MQLYYSHYITVTGQTRVVTVTGHNCVPPGCKTQDLVSLLHCPLVFLLRVGPHEGMTDGWSTVLFFVRHHYSPLQVLQEEYIHTSIFQNSY